MKDKETEAPADLINRLRVQVIQLDRTIEYGGPSEIAGALDAVDSAAEDLRKAFEVGRPATLEGRACGWVYDAAHDYYTTECGEDIAFPEMDRKPPIGREWLKFCSGCGKKALLREAGRVK